MREKRSMGERAGVDSIFIFNLIFLRVLWVLKREDYARVAQMKEMRGFGFYNCFNARIYTAWLHRFRESFAMWWVLQVFVHWTEMRSGRGEGEGWVFFG